MKHILPLFLFLTFIIGQVSGQMDSSSVYKNLKTRKFYTVSSSTRTSNGEKEYNVNGKKVDKSTYNKYHSTWSSMENCTPCILKSYDENDILIRQAVQYFDCGVGWFKKYYPNGNLKLTGFYKENSTGKWKNLSDRGYCNVKNSKWTYFNQNGDTLYSEFWDNGQFIKQYPEQDSIEVWEIELNLNGKRYDYNKIDIEKIIDFKIVAKFKNGNTSDNFRIEIKVPTNYNVKFKSNTTSDPFQEINAEKIFKDAKVPKDKRTSLKVLIYLDNKYVQTFNLRLNL